MSTTPLANVPFLSSTLEREKPPRNDRRLLTNELALPTSAGRNKKNRIVQSHAVPRTSHTASVHVAHVAPPPGPTLTGKNRIAGWINLFYITIETKKWQWSITCCRTRSENEKERRSFGEKEERRHPQGPCAAENSQSLIAFSSTLSSFSGGLLCLFSAKFFRFVSQ